MDCKLFACVYAVREGCIIKGWTDKEGPLNGNKKHCPHYDVQCISAKCDCCGHNGTEDCKGYATVKAQHQLSSEEYFFYEWLILGKGMTTEQFKQLTVKEMAALRSEYTEFEKTLRG